MATPDCSRAHPWGPEGPGRSTRGDICYNHSDIWSHRGDITAATAHGHTDHGRRRQGRPIRAWMVSAPMSWRRQPGPGGRTMGQIVHVMPLSDAHAQVRPFLMGFSTSAVPISFTSASDTTQNLVWKSTSRHCRVKGPPTSQSSRRSGGSARGACASDVRACWKGGRGPRRDRTTASHRDARFPTKGHWLQLEGTVFAKHNPGSRVCADGRDTASPELLPHTWPGSL